MFVESIGRVLDHLNVAQEAEVYQRSMAAVNELEGQFGALWTQCQRCQGSLHQVHLRSH